MNEIKFLKDVQMPFCKGCGHTTTNNNLEKALQKLGYDPLDVVIVTDIGCHGIIDRNLYTHTVHGLHGRSVAVASGISAAIGDKKKVIVMVGDGGATIGMQHLIDAAHRNFEMTVIVLNNMLYGMTGGQPSEFTPVGFRTPTNPEGSAKPYYNICSLVVEAGASYVSRINGIGDFSDTLATAISKKGFSLVEIMEICTSYGVKSNPGMKLARLVQDASLDIKVFTDKDSDPFRLGIKTEKDKLFDEQDVPGPGYENYLDNPLRIMLYGSAGGGVQSAAELLARAAVKAGLRVTKKGSYPVTIGIGFSMAEIILSPDEIHYTGSPNPDHVVILTGDGKDYARGMIDSLKEGILWVDSLLSVQGAGAEVRTVGFTESMGARNAAIYSVFYLLAKNSIMEMDALVEAFNESRLSKKVEVTKFLQFDQV